MHIRDILESYKLNEQQDSILSYIGTIVNELEPIVSDLNSGYPKHTVSPGEDEPYTSVEVLAIINEVFSKYTPIWKKISDEIWSLNEPYRTRAVNAADKIDEYMLELSNMGYDMINFRTPNPEFMELYNKFKVLHKNYLKIEF